MSFEKTGNVLKANSSIIRADYGITIAVDTAYVASQQGKNISTGVYMVDNAISNGSTNEGTTELSTKVPVGSTIGWHSVPINFLSGDTVVITGFNVSQGSVFGSQGYPQAFPLNDVKDGSWWIGQALNQGTQTYQVKLKVTTGKINPVTYYINWDPFITAQ